MCVWGGGRLVSGRVDAGPNPQRISPGSKAEGQCPGGRVLWGDWALEPSEKKELKP